MKVAPLAEMVVGMVGDRAEAQVTVDGTNQGLTRFANSFIHQNVAESGRTVQLKVAVDGKVAAATTTRADEEGLRALVEETIHAAHLRPTDTDWPGLAPPAMAMGASHFDVGTARATPVERATRARDFITAAEGSLAAGYCDTDGGPVAFANSAGQSLETSISRATLDGIHQFGTAAGAGHATAAALSKIEGAPVGAMAVKTARAAADPAELEPAAYEVVLSPECVATMMYFLAFYGWNAKQHDEGQSFVALGESQFDARVTIVDDFLDPLAVGPSFDADGTPKRSLTLVEAGISKALAHDRRTSVKAGTASTGHAIHGGDLYGPVPTNLHFRPGSQSQEEMIASVDRGLFVSSFNYCRILDPRTQVITGLTRNGTFLIEGGEIAGAVSNLRFTQSIIGALESGKLVGVGSDARLADSEVGPGLVSAPSLHLAEWHFTGGAQG